MPRMNAHQEIILVQGTRFTNRQFAEKKNQTVHAHNYLANNEQLKEACWNGMMKEMMPEIFVSFPTDASLYLWQMREGEKVLTMEMSEEPSELDFQASIDPYIIMELQQYN
jgi:hypothetical protein